MKKYIKGLITKKSTTKSTNKKPNIYYEQKCPICKGELQKTRQIQSTYSIIEFTCNNNCYKQNHFITGKKKYIRIFVFDFFYTTQYIDLQKNVTRHFKSKEREIKKEIDNWKENDKYLIKILNNK